MRKSKSISTTECVICHHDKRYHADKENHNLKTSHCTKQLEDNTFCNCKEYKEVKQ